MTLREYARLKAQEIGMHRQMLEALHSVFHDWMRLERRRKIVCPECGENFRGENECICSEWDGKGRSTCGAICPVHTSSEHTMEER